MPDNTWNINSSYPISLAQTFAPPPAPWDWVWWGLPLSMYMPAPAAATTLACHKHITSNAFFGPK